MTEVPDLNILYYVLSIFERQRTKNGSFLKGGRWVECGFQLWSAGVRFNVLDPIILIGLDVPVVNLIILMIWRC